MIENVLISGNYITVLHLCSSLWFSFALAKCCILKLFRTFKVALLSSSDTFSTKSSAGIFERNNFLPERTLEYNWFSRATKQEFISLACQLHSKLEVEVT